MGVVFFLTQLIIVFAYVQRHRFEYIFSPFLMMSVYGIVLWTEKKLNFQLENYIRFGLITTMISHSLLGEYYNLYYTAGWFDNALHLWGAMSFAFYGAKLMELGLGLTFWDKPNLYFVTIVLLGISLGAVFELLEFAMDLFSGGHNQSGLVDTNLDMIFDLLGAIIAASILRYKQAINRV